jgi:hypothetical protein
VGLAMSYSDIMEMTIIIIKTTMTSTAVRFKSTPQLKPPISLQPFFINLLAVNVLDVCAVTRYTSRTPRPLRKKSLIKKNVDD